jgi:hypothetical protein
MTTAAPLARSGDPETSHQAAATVRPHLSELQTVILRVLRMTWELHGRGMTDPELAAHPILRVRPDGKPRKGATIRGRRKDLVQAGLVKASSDVRDRCTVWVPVDRRDLFRYTPPAPRGRLF